MSKTRLAIVVSHPIQYYVPVFRALSRSPTIDPRVFYTWSNVAEGRVFDSGFNAVVAWDVPLLTGYESQFVRNVAKRPGVEHFRGLRTPTLTAEIEAWNADAILVYGWNTQSHLHALLHFHGRLPVLFRGDSTLLDRSRPWRKVLRRLILRWVYRHVDMAVAVGANSRDYFAWCGLPSHRIRIAPHSVDTCRFADNDVDQENHAADWRATLGITPTDVVFLYAGKLQFKKAPDLLLDAFSALRDRCHLIYVGSGELEDPLRARAAGMANVHFVPFQNQRLMPVVYRLGDVFVLPSRGPGETWGLALNEAMACGRALIASSSVGGARDLIAPEINGWIFGSGEVDTLRNLLMCAGRAGRDRLRRMGEASRTMSGAWSTDESARGIERAVAASLAHPSPEIPRRPAGHH